jgi:hypothetical protein
MMKDETETINAWAQSGYKIGRLKRTVVRFLLLWAGRITLIYHPAVVF